MKSFWQNIYAILMLGIVILVVAYIKKPLSCSANINQVKTMIKNLPFISEPIILSKPELINSSSGITYCKTTLITQSGNTIEIPYQVKKEKQGVSVYIDSYDIYDDVVNSIF